MIPLDVVLSGPIDNLWGQRGQPSSFTVPKEKKSANARSSNRVVGGQLDGDGGELVF
jgi:hypothetical protein